MYDNKNVVSVKGVHNGVLCAIAVILILYISIFSVVSVAELGGFMAFVLFAGVYSVMLAKKSSFLCAIPVIVAFTAIIVRAFLSENGFSLVTALKITNVLFALLSAVCLFVCAKKKASGSVTFAAVTVVSTLFVAANILFLVFDVYGNIFPRTVIDAIDKMADLFGNAYRNLFETVLTAAGEKPSLSEIKTITDSIVLSIKATLPSVIIIYSMAFSACSFAFHKFFVRIAAAQKECTEGREVRFNMSVISSVVFEIVYMIYLMLMIFGGNTAIYAAVMNLVYVMSVPFAYIGIRQINSIFVKKISSKAIAAVVIAAGLFIILTLIGPMMFGFIALYGASIELNKRFIPKS